MRARICATLAAGVTVLVTACGAPLGGTTPGAGTANQPQLAELKTVADPKAHRGPSTAALADRSIQPVAERPAQKLPVTVTSQARSGPRQVQVTDTSRVVAIDLAGSVAATLWGLGLGHTQVGRDMSTTFPGADRLPLVTSGGHSVNAEAIVALKPTLLITDGTVGPIDVIQQLRDVGIPVVFVSNKPSFEGAADLARGVAEVLGVPEAGEQLAQRIATEVAQTKAAIAKIAPAEPGRKLRMVFLYIRGSSGIYYLFGNESGADRLVTSLGGVDVAGELDWGGMKPMTDEAMVAANPDLILVMTKGLESAGGVDGLIRAKPAIGLTTAGQQRRFVDMADGDILSFGPRSAQTLDALARAVYAPS